MIGYWKALAGEHDRRFYALIFLPPCLSLLLSFIHIFYLRQNPTYDSPIIDSLEYVQRAEYILNPSMAPRPFLHSPLYAWFLAGVFFYFGESFTLVRVLQTVLNAISCILVYQLGKKCFSPAVGWVAAMGFALYAPVIYFATEIINVPFILFLTLFSLLLLIRAMEEENWKWWLSAGLFSGFNIAARADTIIFYLGAAALVCWKSPRLFSRSAAFVLVMLTPLLFVGIHNFSAIGRFQALPANSGIAFYVGNNPDFINTIGIRPGSSYQNLMERPNREGIAPDRKDQAFNRYFYDQSFEFMVRNPGQYVKCLFYKIRTLIGGYELPETFDLYTFRKYSPVLRTLLFYKDGFGFPFSVVFSLSMIGMIISLRQSDSQWLFMLFPACMLFPLLGYWNSTRYRMAIIPILLLYAGVAIVWIYRQVQGGKIGKIGLFGVVFCLLPAVSSLPYPHFSKDYNFEAEMYISAGLSMVSRGNPDQGLKLLQTGVAMEPDYFYYRGQLAHAFQEKGMFPEALAEYQKALQLNPHDTTLHNNIATLFDKLKEEEMALYHYRTAVGLNPNFSTSRHNLGALLFKKKQYAAAVENLKVAVTFGPDFPLSHYLLGMGLLKLGQKEEGLEEIAKAIRLDPGLKIF
ncbi:MAG: tetratricopeptide repeat protein [Pseudomonadota bacterium]